MLHIHKQSQIYKDVNVKTLQDVSVVVWDETEETSVFISFSTLSSFPPYSHSIVLAPFHREAGVLNDYWLPPPSIRDMQYATVDVQLDVWDSYR